MSFLQTIDNHIIKFGEEDDYLRCRTQFLQRERMDMFAPTFLQFITGKMYSQGSCVVESVTPVPESINNEWNLNSHPQLTYLNSISCDIVTDATTTDTATAYTYNADTNQIQYMGNSWTSSSSYPADVAYTIWDTPISYKDRKSVV